MKTTGIIRHIDELGRVAIPKEIRSAFRLCEGDVIEVLPGDGIVTLRKVSEIDAKEARVRVNALYATFGLRTAICDRGAVVAAEHIARSCEGKPVSDALFELISKGREHLENGIAEPIKLTNTADITVSYVIPFKIKIEGYGAIVILGKETIELPPETIQSLRMEASDIARVLKDS